MNRFLSSLVLGLCLTSVSFGAISSPVPKPMPKPGDTIEMMVIYVTPPPSNVASAQIIRITVQVDGSLLGSWPYLPGAQYTQTPIPYSDLFEFPWWYVTTNLGL